MLYCYVHRRVFIFHLFRRRRHPTPINRQNSVAEYSETGTTYRTHRRERDGKKKSRQWQRNVVFNGSSIFKSFIRI